MSKIVYAVEKLYYFTMIILLSGAFLPLWRSMNMDYMSQLKNLDGDPFVRNVLLFGYIIGFLIVFKKHFKSHLFIIQSFFAVCYYIVVFYVFFVVRKFSVDNTEVGGTYTGYAIFDTIFNSL